MKNQALVTLLCSLPFVLAIGCEPESVPANPAADPPPATTTFPGQSPAQPPAQTPAAPPAAAVSGSLIGAWGVTGPIGRLGLIFEEDGKFTQLVLVTQGQSVGIEVDSGTYQDSGGQVVITPTKSTCRAPSGLLRGFAYNVHGNVLTIEGGGSSVDLVRNDLPTVTDPQIGCVDRSGFHN